MANERLRAALLEKRLTPEDLAEAMGVDRKTADRWLRGTRPYRKHRYDIAKRLGVDEAYLWPDGLPRKQVEDISDSELVAVYPHRSDVPREVWERLFETAEQDIGLLDYDGLFLAEDAALQRILMCKAEDGVRVRLLLGDPESPHLGAATEDRHATAGKVRSAITAYRPLRAAGNVEFRLHRTVLFSSIYRADDQLLVNTHIHGVPAAHAPVWHLRRISGGEVASAFRDSFEHVWDTARPRFLPRPRHAY